MEWQGILVKKIDQREGTGAHGKWVVASYLLTTEDMYPKKLAVEVRNGEYDDRIGHFDSLIGKRVIVKFDIDAREYQGRWYNSIRAFGIKEALTEAEKEERRQVRRQRSELGTIETPEGKTDANATGTVDWDKMGQKAEGKDGEKEGDLPF